MTLPVHWAWIVLLTSFVTIFVHYSVRFGYGILMPEMIVSLKISKAQAGTVASFFYLAYTVFSPLLGFMIDRFSARIILVLFSLILAAGTYLMGKPQNFFQACLAFFIVGMGASAMWIPPVTLIQRWFGVRYRGMALGILSIGYAIGYGVMGLTLPLLVARYEWRACWFILAGLALALVPLNGFFLRNSPQDLNLSPWGEAPGASWGKDSEKRKGKVSYRELLRLPRLWLGGISYFFIAFTAYSVNIFIVTYGALELNYPFAQAAQLASTLAFSGIGGALLLPILSDFIGRKKCLIVVNLSLTLSILLIIGAGNHWLALVIAVGIFGVFYAAAWPMYAAAARDFFPPEATGSILGFWTIFYGVALALAPFLGGYIADLTGTFVYSFLTGIIGGSLATLFVLPLKKWEETGRGRGG